MISLFSIVYDSLRAYKINQKRQNDNRLSITHWQAWNIDVLTFWTQKYVVFVIQQHKVH